MEIEDGLKKVCHDLGSLESVCEGLLDSYFPQIWQLLINKVVSVGVAGWVEVAEVWLGGGSGGVAGWR